MEADVVVIGGGLTGCAAGYYLAKGGVDVLILEQFDLNTQASGSNAGSIHAQIPHHQFIHAGEEWARNFGPTIPLMLSSIELWERLGPELEEDLEFATLGGLIVAENDAQMREIRRKVAIEKEFGLPVEILDRDELRGLAPYVSDRMIGGALCPVEGKANPLKATHALARATQRHGGRVLCGAEVTGIEKRGMKFEISTTRGSVHARRLLDCAGADAGKIARMVGIELPIEAHPIQVSVSEPVEPIVSHLIYFAGEPLTLKQTKSGSLLIGGGWPARLDASTGRLALDPKSLVGNLLVAQKVIPSISDIHLLRIWPAIVNGTEDWKPIIGEIPKVPGFYLAMFPWMGFTAGPIVAYEVAHLILGKPPGQFLSHFSAERYFSN